jgi:hypothetical protein
MADHTIGTFTFERETKNTFVFSRDNNGRKESQYVHKSAFNGGERPDKIDVIIRW